MSSTDLRIVGIVSCRFSRSPAILLLTQHFNNKYCVAPCYGSAFVMTILKVMDCLVGELLFLCLPSERVLGFSEHVMCKYSSIRNMKILNVRNITMFKVPVWDGDCLQWDVSRLARKYIFRRPGGNCCLGYAPRVGMYFCWTFYVGLIWAVKLYQMRGCVSSEVTFKICFFLKEEIREA